MTDTFFSSEAFGQEFEFDRASTKHIERPRKGQREWLQSCIVVAAVTLVSTGVVAFDFSPVDATELAFCIDRGEESPPGGLVSPPLSAQVRAKAEQFRRTFVVVPETEADRTITPDYDL